MFVFGFVRLVRFCSPCSVLFGVFGFVRFCSACSVLFAPPFVCSVCSVLFAPLFVRSFALAKTDTRHLLYFSLLSRYCNLSRCYTPLLQRYIVTFKSKLTYSLGGCVVLARTRNLLIIIYLYERNYDCRCRGYIDITKPANGQRLMANGLILRQRL